MRVVRFFPSVLLAAVLTGSLLTPVAAQEATPEAVVEDPAAR